MDDRKNIQSDNRDGIRRTVKKSVSIACVANFSVLMKNQLIDGVPAASGAG